MKTEQRQRIRQLFIEALHCPPCDRTALLDKRCAGDTALRAEVESLLVHDELAAPGFLRPSEPDVRIRRTAAQVEGDPLIGQQVGRYEIKNVIATGGMGTVYLAEQAQPRRSVALKMMRMDLGSPSAVRRFEYESEILARLQHPNIAQVYEAGTHVVAASQRKEEGEGSTTIQLARELPYFVMEYFPDAKSITKYAAEKKLSTRDRLDLFATVCKAVEYGHRKGIIHRDLKPENILVDADGHVKVIDFGVARATDSDVTVTTMGTDVGQLIGTLQYMSPEQCDADPDNLDTRSDVYSLGVALYELLIHDLPYDVSSRSIYQATLAIKEEPPRRPSTVNVKLRGNVETILLKALEKDREKRYQSAADLGFDIRQYLAGEPIAALPPTAWTRFCYLVSRHPIAANTAICLTIAVITLAATVVSVWWYGLRPHVIVRYKNGTALARKDYSELADEAKLLSISGHDLKTWGGAADSITFTEFVDRPKEFGGGKLALIGYSIRDTGLYQKTLCAYEVPGNLNEPDWQGYIKTGDVLQQLRDDRGYAGDQFHITNEISVVDVFTDPDHPGPEVVAIFTHFNSQRIIRIYNLDGKLLYQVWHDGSIHRPYWLAKAGLLVFFGDNAMVNWDRQGRLLRPALNPLVVFALRPQPGHLGSDWLPSECGDDPSAPVWYKCLRLGSRTAHVTWNDVSSIGLAQPTDSDSGQFLIFNVHVNGKMGVSWYIDEFGNEVTCPGAGGRNVRCTRVVSDPYRSNQLLNDGHEEKLDLPDPDDFHLGPLPPQATKLSAAHTLETNDPPNNQLFSPLRQRLSRSRMR